MNGSNLPKCQQTIADDIEIKIHQGDIKFLPVIFLLEDMEVVLVIGKNYGAMEFLKNRIRFPIDINTGYFVKFPKSYLFENWHQLLFMGHL